MSAVFGADWDPDGDHFGGALDCDQTDARRFGNPDRDPHWPESDDEVYGVGSCDDGIDNDCDGLPDSKDLDCRDRDTDGHPVEGLDGILGTKDDDCDDQDSTVWFDHAEWCDGKDNDCSGEAAEDKDADLWLDCTVLSSSVTTLEACDAHPDCERAEGVFDDEPDCEDTREDRNPGQTEICNWTNPDVEDASADEDCDPDNDVCSLFDGETIDLEDAHAIFVGREPWDHAGMSVAGIGDHDGDGFAEYLVGAGGDQAGLHYGWIFLQRRPLAGEYLLSEWQADEWWRGPEDSSSGHSLLSLGDLDGDGETNLAFGAPGAGLPNPTGHVFLVDGPYQSGLLTDVADATIFYEENCWKEGSSLTSGDLDGDGSVDLAIGAPSDAQCEPHGAVHLFLDVAELVGDVSITSANASFLGDSCGSLTGSSLAAGGVVSDAGPDDLVIGAPGVESRAGAVYLFHQIEDGVDLSSSDADVVWTGASPEDRAGHVVTTGPVDLDGYDDILIGASATDGGAGSVYVILGGEVLQGGSLATEYDACIQGEYPDDLLGYDLAIAGDVDADGFQDILIGAPGAFVNVGGVYIISSTASLPLEGGATYPVSEVKRYTIRGEAVEGAAGRSVAGAGDINGDGNVDILIGAPEAETLTGVAYLLYGGTSE